MSSAVISTTAALGRPFVFDPETAPEFAPAHPEKGHPPQRVAADISARDPRLANVTSASRLNVRPAPEMAPSGIAELDALTGGLPRGCLTEICGSASSGRTTVMLATLAAATRRGEFCVVVDANDSLDPQSVADAGVDLNRLLWVRCGESSLHTKSGVGRRPSDQEQKLSRAFSAESFQSSQSESRKSENRLEQVLRATDLLLESGGFGMIVLDLGDLPEQTARRIPLTTWFRFRRAVEHKTTVLLAIEHQPIAGSCSSLLFKLGAGSETIMRLDPNSKSPEGAGFVSPERKLWEASPENNEPRRGGTPTGQIVTLSERNLNFPALTHAQLLTSVPITIGLMCSRLERKPVRATYTAFTSKTAWAG